jgi:ribosome biogenesis GTPase A
METIQFQEIYQNKKNQLVQCLQEISVISEELNASHQAQNIKEDIQRLKNETFNLVVVGEFSRGKSTFINAMLGKRILPSSASPTTAVISKIMYGKKPLYALHFRDENVQYLDEEQFKDLKAPKATIEETADQVEASAREEAWIASIDYATVQYPLDFCRNNVEIIDTPGVNDISKTRVEITYRFLNQADAAILLLSAKQVLSRSEIEFLKERILGNQIQNIFVVINFKDAVDETKWCDVIEFAREHLAENLHGVRLPDMFLVSSKQALLYRRKANGENLMPKALRNLPNSLEETGMPEFEEALRKFLFTEKGKAKLSKYVSRGHVYVHENNRRIAQQIDDLSHSTDELLEKLQYMKPIFTNTKNKAANISRSLATALRNHESELMLLCNNGLENIDAAAQKSVDGFTLGMDRKALMDMIQSSIAPMQKTFYQDLEEFQKTKINNDVSDAVAQINRIWQEVEISYSGSLVRAADMNTHALAEISVDDSDYFQQDPEVTELSVGLALGGMAALVVAHPIALLGGLFFGFDNVFKFATGLISSILSIFSPSPLEKAKTQIKRSLRSSFAERDEKIRANVEKNYRLQCQQVTQHIESVLNQKVDDLEQQLQAVIHEKEGKDRDVEERIRHLKHLQMILQKRKEMMNEVLI